MELDLANWMTKLPANLQEIPIRQLSIPGSHDSGCFYMDKTLGIAPGAPKIAKNLATFFCGGVESIIYKWSITQDWHIYDQLQNGIRYFDLRVGYKESTKEFYVVHSLYGSTYKNIFEEFKKFAQEHPKEVIILDFNHKCDFNNERNDEFKKLIEESFAGIIYGPGAKGPNCSLKDIWSCGKSIIIFFHDDASQTDAPQFWPQANIYSLWPNTDDADILVGRLNERFGDIKKDRFNVFQAVLSPQASTIIKHSLGGNLKTILAEKCGPRISNWLQGLDEEKKKLINITICDFVDLNEYPSKIIALNYERTACLTRGQ